MKSSIWKSALLGGMSLLAFAAQASAGEVRVTVAEYSTKTAPYFADVEKEFEAANPGIDVQIEIVPWDVLLQKLTTDIAAGTNADLSIIGTRWLIATLPFVLYGMLRYLWRLHARGGGGDPAAELLRDPHLLAATAGWLGLVIVLLGGL